MLAAFIGVVLGITALETRGSEGSVFGVFCGTSPCGEPIRQTVGIPTNAESDIIEWKLTLHEKPSRYELRCDYGLTAPNKPGLAKGRRTLERRGTWTKTKGAQSHPNAVVYDLEGLMSLFEVDENILHMLNRDRSLMLGTSGWSYTLNRSEHSEKPPTETAVASQPDMSYKISPLASGPTVFAVFEGRTPCQGIGRELKSAVTGGCNKVKWRVTLYQNPETRMPTTYKIEGSLHRRAAREGNWTITHDAQRVVYQLSPSATEAALFLLKGDDNVLFFLDQKRKPMVGSCDFSYTLNRRSINGEPVTH